MLNVRGEAKRGDFEFDGEKKKANLEGKMNDST